MDGTAHPAAVPSAGAEKWGGEGMEARAELLPALRVPQDIYAGASGKSSAKVWWGKIKE